MNNTEITYSPYGIRDIMQKAKEVSETKKYEITDITKEVEIRDRMVTLHRVRAIKDFSDLHVGDLGGWIEKEDNLSQYDEAWVADEAMVLNNAQVCDDSRVRGNAIVNDYAVIKDISIISGHAAVNGYAVVSGISRIYDNALVEGYVKINDSEVYGNAVIKDYAQVKDNSVVHGNAVVKGYAIIDLGAQIYGNAKVDDQSHVSWGFKVYGKAQLQERASLYIFEDEDEPEGIVCGNAVVRGTVNIDKRFYAGGHSLIQGDVWDESPYFLGNAFIVSKKDYMVQYSSEFADQPITFYRDRDNGISVSLYGDPDECPLGVFCGKKLLGTQTEVKWYDVIPLKDRRTMACEAMEYLSADYKENVS